MLKYNCALPYIQNANLESDEKQRLQDLHFEIHNLIYDNKYFKPYTYPNGNRIAVSYKYTYDQAKAKIDSIKAKYPLGVITSRQVKLPRRSAMDLTFYINVLPLVNKSKIKRTPIPPTLTPEEISENKEYLAEEPFININTQKEISIKEVEKKYKSLNVIYSDNIINKVGEPGAAQYNRDNNTIIINKKKLLEKFESKAWTKPLKQKDDSFAKSLAENSFITYEEWENFVMEHEFQHSLLSKQDFDNSIGTVSDLGSYEDEINNRALKELNKTIIDNKGQGKLFSISKKTEEISYVLKSVEILQSDKAKQVFEKGQKANWDLNKILTELQIPKEQKQLILDLGVTDRQQLTLELASKYSFAIEINTTKEPRDLSENPDNTQYYDNLTVEGGINYTEQEISTPLITPSIKGHAQFATNNGIGWFRSDERNQGVGLSIVLDNGNYILYDLNTREEIYRNNDLENVKQFKLDFFKKDESFDTSKTRRILEVQSDLFQKGRDKENLILKEKTIYNANEEEGPIHPLLNNEDLKNISEEFFNSKDLSDEIIGTRDWGYDEVREDSNNYYFISGNNKYSTISKNDYEQEKIKFANLEKEQLKIVREKAKKLKENQFLQLLNKDNNWVTFFIKSIIQDSAKKGYEKVMFPRLDTIIQIESAGNYKSYSDAEKIMKNKNWQLENEQLKETLEEYQQEFENRKSVKKDTKEIEQAIINQKERIRSHQPTLLNTAKFYENDLTNILNKTYGKENVKQVTDEFGNTWNEVKIEPTRDTKSILLNQSNTYQNVANEKTIAAIKELLTGLGISLEKVDNLVEEHRSNGIAEFADMIIKIQSGMENVALTEEFMHFVSVMIPDAMLEDLMSNIESYKMYKSVFEQYKQHPAYQNEDGSPNVNKIKIETVGKLLAEYYIMKAEGLTPEEVNIAKTIWGRIKDWLKSLFSNTTNGFSDLIDKLNSGELLLDSEHITRYDKLLQLTEANSTKIIDFLQKDFQKEDLNKYDVNIERINKFLDLVKDFKEQDLPFILSRSKNVSVVKDTFAHSKYFLNDIEKADTLRDTLTNALNYMRSSYNATVTLNNRINNIKKELKEIDPDKYDLIRFKNLELSNIQKILETYNDEFTDLYNMFSEEDSGELIDFLKEAIGEVNSALVNTKTLLKNQAYEQLRKEFTKGKLRNIRIRTEENINNLKQELAEAKSDRLKDILSSKIEALEQSLIKPTLTFDNIIKLLELGEEKRNWFFRLIEGPLTSSNEVIQLITNQLEDVISDVTKEHQGELNELKEIFQGKRQNVQDTTYDKFIQENKKYKFNVETGDLVETNHLELISNVDQTAFENDIEVLKYLKTLPFNKALQRYEELIGGKFTNIRFTEKNQEEFLNDLIKNVYANHVEEKYTDEYYKIYNILNTTISTGESVKEIRSKINDELRKVKSLLDSVVGTNDFELYMEDVRALEAQLLDLELFYDKDNNRKQGDALIIAETLDNWKKAKQKAADEGKPLYKTFITHTAEIAWKEQKRKIDEKYEADPVKYEKERNDWYALNVSVKHDPRFIQERNDIFKVIGQILEKYDSPAFNELNREISDIRRMLYSIITKYTEEGTVNGNNATLEEQLFVKNKENQLAYLKEEIRKNKTDLTAKDYKDLTEMFSDLEKIQTEGVTEHWMQALSLLGENLSQEQLLENQFVKNNVINVTDKYLGKPVPLGFLVSSDKEIFAPTMLWRNTISTNPEYKKEIKPSYKWNSSRVNEIYENEKSITGKRKVKSNSSIYTNSRYGQLTSDEILFVEKVRNKYYQDQMKMPMTMRLGDTLPFMQKSGIQKTAKGIKNIFSPETYKAITWERFLGKDFRENVLGEGKEDKGRKQDINSYSYKFKYGSDSNDMLSQERDLYKLLKSYNYEAIKYNRMKMLLPELNSVRKVIVDSLQKNKNNTNLLKDLDIFVEKSVNKKTTKENTPLNSFVRKFTSSMRGLSANVFLYLPWLYTGSIKSFVANAYFAFNNHSFLKQFSQGSLIKGYKSAAGRLLDYTYNEYKLVPSKYTAIMKRLRLISESTLNEDLDANTNMLLKIANNMGYVSSLGHRQASERYVMFAMSEMYFQTLGKEIEDYYDYDEKTGTVTLKEGEKLDENKITADVRDMAQFTLGNYNPANDPIVKHTVLGQLLMFFGNHIPNGIISRVGPGTTLRSGVEVKPYMAFWRPDVRKVYLDLFKGLMSMDALTILKHKHLTPTEKDILFRFYKDFLLVNLLGAGYYILSKAMQESGDDDDELSWYALMVFRKAYSEMSYFNPVEKAGIPLRLLTDEKFGYRGNGIQKTFDYIIGKKAVEILTPSIFPGDFRGLRFDTEDIKTKDPYYAQYKNNLLLYNFHRYTRTKALFDYKYSKEAIKGFEYFDKSIYQFEKK